MGVGTPAVTLQGLLPSRLSSPLPSPEMMEEFLVSTAWLMVMRRSQNGGRRWWWLVGREREREDDGCRFLERESEELLLLSCWMVEPRGWRYKIFPLISAWFCSYTRSKYSLRLPLCSVKFALVDAAPLFLSQSILFILCQLGSFPLFSFFVPCLLRFSLLCSPLIFRFFLLCFHVQNPSLYSPLLSPFFFLHVFTVQPLFKTSPPVFWPRHI